MLTGFSPPILHFTTILVADANPAENLMKTEWNERYRMRDIERKFRKDIQ